MEETYYAFCNYSPRLYYTHHRYRHYFWKKSFDELSSVLSLTPVCNDDNGKESKLFARKTNLEIELWKTPTVNEGLRKSIGIALASV